MKKVILFILFFVVGVSMTPQDIKLLEVTTKAATDSTFEAKLESVLNDINHDLSKAEEEKKIVDEKLKLNKLLEQEKNNRLDRIMKKLRHNKELPQSIERQKSISVKEKQRYIFEKDSICVRKALFSDRCIKWDKFYVMVDNKTKDTLILKPN